MLRMHLSNTIRMYDCLLQTQRQPGASNTGSPDYSHLPEDSGRSALSPQPAGAALTIFKATEALSSHLRWKSIHVGLLMTTVFSFRVKQFLISLKIFYKKLIFMVENKIYIEAATYPKRLRKWVPSEEKWRKLILITREDKVINDQWKVLIIKKQHYPHKKDTMAQKHSTKYLACLQLFIL